MPITLHPSIIVWYAFFTYEIVSSQFDLYIPVIQPRERE